MKNNYELNLKTIEKINKNFSNKLKQEKKLQCENIQILNKNNFLIKEGSKEILAYVKDNEYEQADTLIKNFSFHSDEATVIIGIGNGYLLNQSLKKADKKHLFLLIEPIYQLINNCFEHYDYSKYIEAGQLMICTNVIEVPSVFAVIESQRVIQCWHTMIENYTLILKQYKDIRKLTMDTLNQIMCNVGTVMGAGKIIAENDIKNLPYVIKHRGVNDIKNLFKNKPALIIASAPTVTKLIPQLLDKKIRDNIIIIAIAQMLRPLLAFGIKPDFICSVDYGEVNYEHFDNLWYVKDIPFVALNRSYAPILEKWQGYKFITAGFNPAPKESIIDIMNQYGQLEQGGSVVHMAIGLGIHLGCNPIIEIGFNCGYDRKEGLSHNQLGDAVGKIEFNKDGTLKWKVDDPNSTLKNKNHEMGNMIEVDGYFGDKIPTNIGLASFITTSENIFQRYPKIKFINANEGGAKKKYCEQMSLKLALQKFANKKINKKVLNKYLTLKPNYEKDIEEAKKRLKCEIDLFEKEIETCNKALNPLDKMLKAKGKELEKLFKENEKYAIEAQDIAKKSNLLSLHIYKTSREIMSRELKVQGDTKHLKKDIDDLKIRIKRSKLILESAKESAEKLKDIYINVLKQLDKNIEDNKVAEPEINIKPETWDKLIKNGNWARPLLESKFYLENPEFNYKYHPDTPILANEIYNKCFKMKQKVINEDKEDKTNEIEFNKFIEYSRESGLKKDFKSCLNYLKKANKIFPDNQICLWGLASVYYQLYKINKSILIYEKLIKLFPNNLRYQFEYGQVWLLKNIEKGIDIIIELFNKTKEFDSFKIRIAELYYGFKDYENAEKYTKEYLEIYSHSQDAKNLLKNIKNKT